MVENSDAKTIRTKISELELHYRETERSCNFLEENIRESIARTEKSIDSGVFKASNLKELEELLQAKKKGLNDVCENRDKLRYEYRKQLTQYNEELRLVEGEDKNEYN